MPIRKFRRVEDMEGEHWYEPGDPALFRAIRRVWELGHRTLKHHFPPGAYRHCSIEEMNAHQERWDKANFEAYQTRLRQEKDAR